MDFVVDMSITHLFPSIVPLVYKLYGICPMNTVLSHALIHNVMNSLHFYLVNYMLGFHSKSSILLVVTLLGS